MDKEQIRIACLALKSLRETFLEFYEPGSILTIEEVVARIDSCVRCADAPAA